MAGTSSSPGLRGLLSLLVLCAHAAAAAARVQAEAGPAGLAARMGEHDPHENSLAYVRPELLPAKEEAQACEGCKLEANASVVEDGQFVSIDVDTAAYAQTNRNTHWLAVYTPEDADPTATTPVKFVVLGEHYVDAHGRTKAAGGSHGKQYVETGRANVKVQLIDFRTDGYALYVYAGGLHLDWNDRRPPDANATLVVRSSSKLTVQDAGAPRRPRASLVDNGKKLRIVWSAGSEDGAAVAYTSSSGAERTVAAATIAFDKDAMCTAPATTFGYRDMKFILTADVPLYDVTRPEFEYCLVSTEHARACHTFRLPPLPGSAPTVLLLTADMGQGAHPHDDGATWPQYGQPSYHVIANMAADMHAIESDVARMVHGGPGGAELKAHAVFHAGDLGYAIGYLAVWDWWLWTIERVSSSILYLTNQGNHENDAPTQSFQNAGAATWYNGTDSGGECGVPASRLLPNSRVSFDEDWWSQDIGLVHVVSMNTEMDFRRGSRQHNWLKRDLASVDRAVTPWIVLGGHRPMYIDSSYSCDAGKPTPPPCDVEVAKLLVDEVEPLLVEYEVDVAFWGHNHVYQRHCAARGGKCERHSEPWDVKGRPAVAPARSGDPGPGNTTAFAVMREPRAPMQFVIGAAGAGFTKNAYGSETDERCLYEHGHTRFYAFNATVALMEFVSLGPQPDTREVGAMDVRDTVLIMRAQSPWNSGGDGGSGGGAHAGVIAGAVVGSLAAVVGAGFGAWHFWLRRHLQRASGAADFVPLGSVVGDA